MTKPITVKELIELAKNSPLTSERIEAVRLLVAEAEKRYEEDAKRREVTHEFLRRTYNL